MHQHCLGSGIKYHVCVLGTITLSLVPWYPSESPWARSTLTSHPGSSPLYLLFLQEHECALASDSQCHTKPRERIFCHLCKAGNCFQSVWELLHSLGNALQCALPPWPGRPSQKVGSIAPSDQVAKLSFFKNWLPLNCKQVIHGNFKEQIERALQGEEKTTPNQIRVTYASC